MMLYCPQNITFLKPWVDNGLSHCFIDTVSSLFIFNFSFLCGGIQFYIYRKYSSELDTRVFPKSCLFKTQIFLHILLPMIAFLRLLLQCFVLYDHVLYGYMILSAILYMLSFPIILQLLFLERSRALPSVPTQGHGLILLVTWTAMFVNENLTFINLKNETWWFNLDLFSNRLEFGLFILRYIGSLFIFALGLKAPGILQLKDYFHQRQLHVQGEQESFVESGAQPTERNGSTFTGLAEKIKMLIPFLWPKKSLSLQFRVAICFLTLILGRIINVYVPIYNKYIVNSLSTDLKTDYQWNFILIYVLLWFLQGQGNNSFLNNVRSFIWIRVQQYTVKEVELEMYQHLHSLSLNWHLSRKIGEVLRVMDRGTSSISSLLSYIIFNILPTFLDIFIAVIYFALAFNIWFGLIVLITMVLYLFSTIMLTEWRTKYRRDANTLDNAVEAKCVDSLLNFETVKYYNAEKYELENLKEAIDEFQVAEWKSTASLNLLNTVQNGVITLGVMGGALLCAHYVLERQLTAGDYVLFSSYILQLYTPLNYFGTYYRMVQTAFVDMENMFSLLENVPEVVDDPNARCLKVGDGRIEFKNVNFSYLPERQILKDISFVIPPGKTVAVVGPTGSGKSTITRLLFRFYNIHSGNILIDGQNITQVTQDSLRDSIGVVPQDTVLFNKDIRYNIRYGKVTASDEEVEAAAKAADIHNQILSFPNVACAILGYETIVGERGLKLSGGEKQRVAIARTILKAPSFIILDEATSSLDTQTERNIQQSLSEICVNRTSLVVAHRLSTIVNADQILVMKEGEIVERGSHEELLALQGTYSAMWQQQSEDEKRGTIQTVDSC